MTSIVSTLLAIEVLAYNTLYAYRLLCFACSLRLHFLLYEESGKDNIPFDFFKEVYILTFLSLVDCSSNLHKVKYIYTLMGMINL